MRTKLLLLLITILVATFISVPGCGGGGGDDELPIVVVFTDPDLEQAVRDALVQPTGHILADSLLGLLTLDASNLTIADLEGLQYCLDLETLFLQNNNLTNASNINYLSALVNLTTLRLDGNGISTLGWVSALDNLLTLNLSGNNIVNIGALADRISLVILRLANNQIVNIDALELLVDLETLILNGNLITDITALINNTGIDIPAGDTVEIEDNPLSCQAFADIAGEPRLAGLLFTDPDRTFADALLSGEIGTIVGHASPYLQSELCAITTLNIPLIGITDLDGLEFCYELENIDLHANNVTDLTPLADLGHMLVLNLSDNVALVDLTPLANLTLMQELNLANDGAVVDLAPIENMADLGMIDLTNALLFFDSTPLCDCYDNGGLHDAGDTVTITGSGLAPLFPGDACLDQLALDGVTIVP